MALSISKKLKIKQGDRILTVNAPFNLSTQIEVLPGNVSIGPQIKNPDQIHWFVKSKKELESSMDKILPLIKDGVICWIYYPKGSSGIQTDLTRDRGWERLRENELLQWLSLISFNDTWSAFAIKFNPAHEKKEQLKSCVKTVSRYIDPVKKSITLPEDFSNILRTDRSISDFFDSLSFSNRKEYIEWIESAKKDETRKLRLKESMIRLGKKWKNPANR